MWYLVIALVLIIVLGGGFLIHENRNIVAEYHEQLELEERENTKGMMDLHISYLEQLSEAEKGVKEIMESYDNDKLDFDEKIASYQQALEHCQNEINRLAGLLAERNQTVEDMTVAIEMLDSAMAEREAEDVHVDEAEITRP